MADLRRVIIILMALACVVNVIGIIHCHVRGFSLTTTYGYSASYIVTFPILLSVTGFLLLEQLLITDGTLAPLNRLRIIFAFGAAVALIVFGIGAAVTAHYCNNRYDCRSTYHNGIVAAVIAFIGAAIYIGEAVARNRKSRIV